MSKQAGEKEDKSLYYIKRRKKETNTDTVPYLVGKAMCGHYHYLAARCYQQFLYWRVEDTIDKAISIQL